MSHVKSYVSNINNMFAPHFRLGFTIFPLKASHLPKFLFINMSIQNPPAVLVDILIFILTKLIYFAIIQRLKNKRENIFLKGTPLTCTSF